MRALSVRQPWAWAIINAGKDIENRSWQNRYCTGTIAIHASSAVDDLSELPADLRSRAQGELVRSAIIGVVDIVEVVEHHRSRWFSGPLGWVLRNPRKLQQPIPCSGRLGLWPLPPAIERQILRQTAGHRTRRLEVST